jgi:environmental stress-induced protein Ves
VNAVHLVALADCTAMPWRNGGGITHDLLAWPLGETPWQLRVSVASIARDGPFSRFDGVQRWFTVLSGAGVRLQWPHGASSLVPGDPPLGFDGADPPGCTLLAGSTLDLNLMALHSAGRVRMARVGAGQPLRGTHCWRGLYTTAPAVLQAAGQHHPLAAHTLVWTDAADARTLADKPDAPHSSDWTLTNPTGPAWWLTLEA